jgi:hypothetical protein
MPMMFNTLLEEAGLKLSEVRLVRHKDRRAKKGRTPYELWINNRPKFEAYQSLKSIQNRPKFNAAFWAVFVVNFFDETVFAGLYSVEYVGLLKKNTPMIHMDGVDKAGTCDVYKLELEETLGNHIGKLIINWGPSPKAWIQHAERQNKQIIDKVE